MDGGGIEAGGLGGGGGGVSILNEEGSPVNTCTHYET